MKIKDRRELESMIDVITSLEDVHNREDLEFIKYPCKQLDKTDITDVLDSETIKEVINNIEHCEMADDKNFISNITKRPVPLSCLSSTGKIFLYIEYILKSGRKDVVINIYGLSKDSIEQLLERYEKEDLIVYVGIWSLPFRSKCSIKLNGHPLESVKAFFEDLERAEQEFDEELAERIERECLESREETDE